MRQHGRHQAQVVGRHPLVQSRNFRGSLGNFRGTSGLLLSSTVRELPGKSPKTSGEVRGTSGLAKFVSKCRAKGPATGRHSANEDAGPCLEQAPLQASKPMIVSRDHEP